ncbi:oligosaccharide flippase family protein [Allomeiothermus silvanus]|uniref:oligosaccharide flippase family protein n=1 Tax=Allomeiothermus silvanus TaxID=52022 RepID=UPI00019E8EB7|nr:oligosaccharide flippase family protein [Allomeiothermus silvanus]
MNIAARAGQLLRGSTVQNLLALYGVQFANYLLPLLTLPYLARVLGPEGWGSVAIVQSFAQYLSLLVEYGFNLSATREVARYRTDQTKLAELLAGVSGAKLILALLAILLTFLLSLWVDNLGRNPPLLWSGVFWAVAWAFSPIWFFQGLERLRLVAGLEVGTKLASLILIFALVREPSDAWKVLFLQGLSSALASGLALFWAYREVGFRWAGWHIVLEALRSGWSLFFFRAAVSLYTVGNVFILGLFVAPHLVAYYAGAERLTKAFLGMLEPLNRTFFPRLSHLARYSMRDAAWLASRVTVVMGLGGLIGACLVAILAPWIVKLLLGTGYEPAAPLMRILALLLPMIALSNALGIQWMLALGLDRPFNVVILMAGLLNLGLALVLVPRLAHVGMAYVVVLVEVFVTGGILFYLWRSGKTPWQMRRNTA